jgi:hypothetical protein
MKTKRHIICASSLSLCLLNGPWLLSGCGVEVENPGNPKPDPAPKTANRSEVDAPKSDTPLGTQASAFKPCSLTISRGETNSSGNSGAKVSFTITSPSISGELWWVKNDAQKSEVRVTEQTFGSDSAPAATYAFEFRSSDNKKCIVQVTITPEDIANQIKINLQITLPPP